MKNVLLSIQLNIINISTSFYKMLVINCCMTNYHLFSNITQCTCIIPQFIWVRSLDTSQLSPLLRVSQS